jgi:hypothetical protein
VPLLDGNVDRNKMFISPIFIGILELYFSTVVRMKAGLASAVAEDEGWLVSAEAAPEQRRPTYGPR